MEDAGADDNARARHDAAVATARAILEVVSPCLRPEEQRDAYEEFYRAVSAGLEAYEALRGRDFGGLAAPSRN